ncbi:hypothetical protein TRVL_06858 [Trypanosoma vivax]|nr:hypothetical protein TRVL_06858 [Trypanosoma vivax]
MKEKESNKSCNMKEQGSELAFSHNFHSSNMGKQQGMQHTVDECPTMNSSKGRSVSWSLLQCAFSATPFVVSTPHAQTCCHSAMRAARGTMKTIRLLRCCPSVAIPAEEHNNASTRKTSIEKCRTRQGVKWHVQSFVW